MSGSTMTKHNPENERIKRRFFTYLKEAKQYSESTVDAAAKALNRWEEYTNYRDFKAFHYEQAVAFKKRLAEQKGVRSGERLSKATLHFTFMQLKCFFQWLSMQSGFRAKIRYCDADYFNLSEKDVRVATAKREKKWPTLEQVKHVLATMPIDNEVAMRNRSLIAFTILTGARDRAIASMKLKHVDLLTGSVYQDAREVKTKFSKTFRSYFFPVGTEITQIVTDWVSYLKEKKFWSNDDPLFPATHVAPGPNQQFQSLGLKKSHWSNASAIRKIFRESFAAAGLPYFNPHSFRNTLVRLGQCVCKSPEDFKAWSQNLGHEKVLTTFLNYGEIESHRQGEILRNLEALPPFAAAEVENLARLLDQLRKTLSDKGNGSIG
jgi:integrase